MSPRAQPRATAVKSANTKSPGSKGKANNKQGPSSARAKWIIGVAGILVIVVIASLAVTRALKQNSSEQQSGHSSDSPFSATIANKADPALSPPEGMVWIPGGEFSMGSTI